MGFGWKIEGEFYGRRSEVPEARPGQHIDDILMPYIQEFPNVPEFPNANAPEFHMPVVYVEEPPMQVAIQQPPPEANPEEGLVQNRDQDPHMIKMSADMNQNQDLQMDQPQQNMEEEIPRVPIEPVPIEPIPFDGNLQLIDEILQENEDERDIELMLVEHQELDRLLN